MTASRFWTAADIACKSVRGVLGYIGAAVDTVVKAEVQHPYYTPDLLGPLPSAAGAGAERPAGVSVKQSAPPAGHPTSAEPPTAVDDPAGAPSPLAPAGSPPPDWNDLAVPAICEVLALHPAYRVPGSGRVVCDHGNYAEFDDWQAWREHIAPLIADRLASDPRPAVKALAAIYINQF